MLGLYTHIPFCQAKCSYCHFLSFPYQRKTAERYKEAVRKEIVQSTPSNKEQTEVDTVYFGGGTPSLVPAGHICEILDAIRKTYRIREDCEISIEANPGTLSAEKIESFLSCGVNRFSIGAQSFLDAELAAIGRLHTPQMVHDAVGKLKQRGVENLNLDLMLGLPLQTRQSWRKNLEIFAALDIPHLSVYMLDLDDKCALADMVDNGTVSVPEEDLVSDLYLETIEFLSSRGYPQYEISNFARPGYACRHNLKYWRREPVLGFGLGSHSFDGTARYANKPGLEDYLQTVEKGLAPTAWREPVGAFQALQESLFLGLRMTEGIDWTRLTDIYGSDQVSMYLDLLRDLSARGLVRWNNSRVGLSASGMLLSNEIFQQFV